MPTPDSQWVPNSWNVPAPTPTVSAPEMQPSSQPLVESPTRPVPSAFPPDLSPVGGLARLVGLPKAGLLPRSFPGTGSGMLKTTGTGLYVIPDLSKGTGVPNNGTANLFGNWTEFVASTSVPIYLVGFAIQIGPGVNYVEVSIGTGTGGSESDIYKSKVNSSGTSDGQNAAPPILIAVASGTRVAVQVGDDKGAAGTHYVTLFAVAQSDVEGIAA